jgi:RsiW-degrading membrane proteinase PrsW (M82 family)
MMTARTDDAAARYEREGLFFGASSHDEREEDVERAIEMWIASEAWDKVGEKLADHRYERLVHAPTRLRYALHARDWRGALRWFFPANLPDFSAHGVLALAGLSALAWFWFCSRVGQLGERPKFRAPLYVLALLLGVASVYMTLALVYIEEIFLHFHEKKNAIANAIYFVLGVGLREELSKLVFFAPLLPILRRWGGRREVVACGALVGLGFAAEENIGYFSHGDLATALARFLTANFFHMSTAAISASALYDFASDREKHAQTLSRAFLLVMGIHGLYDFFLSFPKWSFLSMVGFVLISREFLSLVRGLRGTKARGVSLLTRFVVALSVLSGAGFVYGTFVAGPALAARAMAEGLLGLAVIIYFFVQELEGV